MRERERKKRGDKEVDGERERMCVRVCERERGESVRDCALG